MSRFTNNIYKYMQPFHFRSVFFKYLKQFTLISVIPFLMLSMLVYFTQAKNSKIASNSALERLSSSVTSTLNHAFLKSEQVANSLELSSLDYFITADIDNVNLVSKLLSSMRLLLAQNENIHSIHAYRFTEDKFLSTATINSI